MTHLPIVREIFKVGGLWGNTKLSKPHLFTVRFFFALAIYYWFGITYNLFATVIDRKAQFIEKWEALFTFSGYTVVLSSYIVLYYKRVETQNMLNDIEDFEMFGCPNNVIKVTKTLDILCLYAFCYCGFGHIIFSIIGFTQYENCLEENLANERNLPCGFTLQISYPYDFKQGILLYLHLCIEVCVAPVFFFGPHLVVCSIVAVEMIILRLNHLGNLLKELNKIARPEIRRWKFRHCIIYHIHIINLADKVNNIYQMGTTIIILSYGVTVGSILITILEKQTLIALMWFTEWTILMFCLCVSGQRLQDYSLAIAEIAYDLDWINYETTMKKDVNFLIMRANKPLTYGCAWGVGEFCMLMFQKVMSAAYTFTSLKTTVGK